MAGYGQRFVDAGYQDPKPTIMLQPSGRRIIDYVVNTFDPTDKFIFICNEDHLKDPRFRATIYSRCKDAKVVSIPAHKRGPIHTIREAYDVIDDDDELIVAYCDGAIRFDQSDFNFHVKANNMDGCLFTHCGFHPHTLSSTKMAFIRHEGIFVLEVKEKACFTDNPQAEHASSGVYYFGSGRIMKQCFDETVRRNIHYNGEFYVTLAYNVMIEAGQRVGYYSTPHFACLGTPTEVRNFEAWNQLVKFGNVATDADILKTFRYWQAFHQDADRR